MAIHKGPKGFLNFLKGIFTGEKITQGSGEVYNVLNDSDLITEDNLKMRKEDGQDQESIRRFISLGWDANDAIAIISYKHQLSEEGRYLVNIIVHEYLVCLKSNNSMSSIDLIPILMDAINNNVNDSFSLKIKNNINIQKELKDYLYLFGIIHGRVISGGDLPAFQDGLFSMISQE